MNLRQLSIALAVVLLAAACGSSGQSGSEAGETPAAEEVESVRVGVILPLTGSSAAAGEATLNGVNLAAQIVNDEFPDLGDLPLATTAGLPNLGGAPIEVVSADHEGSPEKGASETERLINSEGVVAMLGAYFSSVTTTASERAERLGIPFVNGASSSPALTERGLEYFFRTGPSDLTFGETFFDFLDDLQEEGEQISEVAILAENTAYGSDAAAVTQQLAEERGYAVSDVILHANEVSDVTSEATRLSNGDPDAVFQASYTPEAILFTNTFRQLNYAPNLLAYGAGFSDPAYYEAVGTDGEFTIVRAAWALDAVSDRPAAVSVAEMYEEQFGQPLDENAARTFTAALTLFHAIDEAGSTEPDAIRDALAAVDLPAEATIMPWEGIRFADSGQNELARGVLTQRQGGEFKVVWPFDTADADLVWPLPPYSERQ